MQMMLSIGTKVSTDLFIYIIHIKIFCSEQAKNIIY